MCKCVIEVKSTILKRSTCFFVLVLHHILILHLMLLCDVQELKKKILTINIHVIYVF